MQADASAGMLRFLAWYFFDIFLACLCDGAILAFLELARQFDTKWLGRCPGYPFIWMAQLPVVLIYVARDLRHDKRLLFLGLFPRNCLDVNSADLAVLGLDAPVECHSISIWIHQSDFIVFSAG